MNAQDQHEEYAHVRVEMDGANHLCVGLRVRVHDGREITWQSIRLTPRAGKLLAEKLSTASINVEIADHNLGEFGSGAPGDAGDEDGGGV